MQNNVNEIAEYLKSMHSMALVQVQHFQDGFATSTIDDVPCADFQVADGALAWSLPGGARPHAVFAQRVRRQDDELTVWHEQADTGFGVLVRLSPLWTEEQLTALGEWLMQRGSEMDEQTRTRLLEACAGAKHDADRHATAVQVERTYLVAGVDRAGAQAKGEAGLGLHTVGALVVAVDGEAFQFVGLPGVADMGLAAEFDQRAQLAAQAGVNWADLFTAIIASGNGYTADFSEPEPIRAPDPLRAGYRWLRKRMAGVAPGLVQ